MGVTAGNTRLIYAAIQSAKGSPAANPTHCFRLNGDGAIDPNRSIIQLPETDASSQRPVSQVVGAEPSGGWQGWLRPSEFAFLGRAIMGANADSGAGPFVHTATPVAAIPYLTLWDVIPGVQCTRFDDGRLSQLGCSGQSLAGVQYSAQAIALSATLGVTEPTLPAAPATDQAMSYPMVTVSLAAAHPGTVDQFTLLINRNVTLLRGDNGLGAYDSVVGLFDVTGTFSKIYTSDADYRRFHGGSSGATALTTTIYAEAFDLLIAIDATHSVDFTSTGIEYSEVRVPVNVDGTPIIETASFNTQRQPTWANNLTIVTKNGLALSTTSPT
jgi:hypothetical protein